MELNSSLQTYAMAYMYKLIALLLAFLAIKVSIPSGIFSHQSQYCQWSTTEVEYGDNIH